MFKEGESVYTYFGGWNDSLTDDTNPARRLRMDPVVSHLNPILSVTSLHSLVEVSQWPGYLNATQYRLLEEGFTISCIKHKLVRVGNHRTIKIWATWSFILVLDGSKYSPSSPGSFTLIVIGYTPELWNATPTVQSVLVRKAYHYMEIKYGSLT